MATLSAPHARERLQVRRTTKKAVASLKQRPFLSDSEIPLGSFLGEVGLLVFGNLLDAELDTPPGIEVGAFNQHVLPFLTIFRFPSKFALFGFNHSANREARFTNR